MPVGSASSLANAPRLNYIVTFTPTLPLKKKTKKKPKKKKKNLLLQAPVLWITLRNPH